MPDNISSEVGVSQPEQPKAPRKAVKSPTSKDPHAQHLALAITRERDLGVLPHATLQMIGDYRDIPSGGGADREYLSLTKIKESVRSSHTDAERQALLAQDLESARLKLSELPVVDSVSLGTALDGVKSKPVFQLVDTDKIVGMSINNGQGWADENESRSGRVAKVAKGVLGEEEAQLEEIFHPDKPNQRIKLTAIQGPAGPMYSVDDGTHRVSGCKLAGIETLPADVVERTYPSIHYTYDKTESMRWEALKKIGMIEGMIEEYVSEGGTPGVRLNLQSEVLPWIRNSQTNLIRTSQMYESLYPGSLDNLPIPKEALLDPIANNYFMADRWNKWVKLSESSQASVAEGEAGSKRDNIAQKEEQEFTYKGVKIEGIGRLEKQGVMTRDEVVHLLDRLPEGYFEHIPVSAIVFEPYKLFSIQRDGKVAYVREDDLLPTDKIIARKKGEMTWNSHEEDGVPQISDGRMTIHVYSPENWDNKKDKQTDKEIALATLAHEAGHATWGAIAIGPQDIWRPMRKQGLSAPTVHSHLSRLQALLGIWRELPESTLERFQEYRKVFEKDAKIDRSSEKEVREIAYEEDFAIAHEYYLYWQNLEGKDIERFETLDNLYEIMSQPPLIPKG